MLSTTAPAHSSALIRSSALKKGSSPEALYQSNLGLVGFCLKRFPSLTGADREDAYVAGLLGLWKAAQGFDPDRGFQFSTYATNTIRGYLLKHVREMRRPLCLNCVPLETPLGEKGRLEDIVADEHAEKPGKAALDQAGFDALVSCVPARQQGLLRSVYGKEMTLAEAGEAEGISQQRTHQLCTSAIQALRRQHGRKKAAKKRVTAVLQA